MYQDYINWKCQMLLNLPIFDAFNNISGYRRYTIIVFRWLSCRHAGSLNMRLYSVLPSPLLWVLFYFIFFCLLLSKHKEVLILAVYCFFPLDLHFATTQACFCKDVKDVFWKNVWHVYVLRGVRTWKSYAKSDLTSQTETDFQKCDLNRIPNHIRM